MIVYQLRGYPTTCYFVSHSDWSEMMKWLYQNDVEFMQESSGQHGIGFSINRASTESKLLFKLRWL